MSPALNDHPFRLTARPSACRHMRMEQSNHGARKLLRQVLLSHSQVSICFYPRWLDAHSRLVPKNNDFRVSKINKSLECRVTSVFSLVESTCCLYRVDSVMYMAPSARRGPRSTPLFDLSWR
jgi:hypothetical protein